MKKTQKSFWNNSKPWLHPAVRAFVRRALEEDIGAGDITSETLLDPKCRVCAGIIARRNYVIAGVEIVRLVCRLVDRQIDCRVLAPDGREVKAGETIVVLTGRALSILAQTWLLDMDYIF